jgi:hypothetical protein
MTRTSVLQRVTRTADRQWSDDPDYRREQCEYRFAQRRPGIAAGRPGRFY